MAEDESEYYIYNNFLQRYTHSVKSWDFGRNSRSLAEKNIEDRPMYYDFTKYSQLVP